MQRIAQVVRLKPEKAEEYKRLHEAVWPEVLDRIRRCHIRNYSIHLQGDLLFAYFEYHGTDFAADMAAMAADGPTQEWWKLTDACQEPVDGAAPGELWARGGQVFLMEE